MKLAASHCLILLTNPAGPPPTVGVGLRPTLVRQSLQVVALHIHTRTGSSRISSGAASRRGTSCPVGSRRTINPVRDSPFHTDGPLARRIDLSPQFKTIYTQKSGLPLSCRELPPSQLKIGNAYENAGGAKRSWCGFGELLVWPRISFRAGPAYGL